MTEFLITADRFSGWSDAEVRRRLGRCYALILDHRHKNTGKKTTDQSQTLAQDQTVLDNVPGPPPEAKGS